MKIEILLLDWRLLETAGDVYRIEGRGGKSYGNITQASGGVLARAQRTGSLLLLLLLGHDVVARLLPLRELVLEEGALSRKALLALEIAT